MTRLRTDRETWPEGHKCRYFSPSRNVPEAEHPWSRFWGANLSIGVVLIFMAGDQLTPHWLNAVIIFGCLLGFMRTKSFGDVKTAPELRTRLLEQMAETSIYKDLWTDEKISEVRCEFEWLQNHLLNEADEITIRRSSIWWRRRYWKWRGGGTDVLAATPRRTDNLIYLWALICCYDSYEATDLRKRTTVLPKPPWPG